MKKILMIDDEVSFTDIVKLNLEGTGNYEVKTEFNGASGIETAKSFKPDLILLDIVMSEDSGIKILELLKESIETKEIPVIIMSSLRGAAVKEKVARRYCIGYIEKPIGFDALQKKLEQVLK